MNDSAAGHDILFSPFSFANLTLPNRIVMSPMTRSRSPAGVPGADVAAYYRRRANAGLIVTEGVWIPHPSAADNESVPCFYGADALAGWSQVLAEVHAAGGRIAPQLWHVGLFGAAADDGLLRAAASKRGPSGYLGGMGRAPVAHGDPMSVAEIEAVIEAYGQAAATAFNMGFDGVALHGAHGYLIDQFLWEETNHRNDAYGGDVVRRSAFAAAVVRECRKRTHARFPILLRVSQWKLQNYEAKLANDVADLEAILTPIVDAGVDCFDCSQRRFWEPAFEDSSITFAGWVKKITGRATMTVGSVGLDADLLSSLGGVVGNPVSLDQVRKLLDTEEVDLVGVGRALLADPNWIAKIERGSYHELTPFSVAALAELF